MPKGDYIQLYPNSWVRLLMTFKMRIYSEDIFKGSANGLGGRGKWRKCV